MTSKTSPPNDKTPAAASAAADASDKRKWIAAGLGVAGFLMTGFFLVPGLITPEPKPVAEPPDSAASQRALPRGAANTSPFASAGPETGDADFLADSFSFDCMIAPNETVDIGSSITGLIESIDVERSEYVEKGQVIARLESRVEEAAVRVARARAEREVEIDSSRVSAELGRKRRDRAAVLFEEATLSVDLRDEVETEAALAALGVEQARENHKLAKLQLQQAEASLARRIIRSPITGFVTERLMAPGEVVEEGTILRLAALDPLRVDVILPADLFGHVKPGDEVEIVPEAPLDEARTAEVAIVDRTLDGASGTFAVRMLLPNPDYTLPGGLRCQARMPEVLARRNEGRAVKTASASAATPATR